MATLPYVTAPGNVTKALNGIITASTPERVTQDFVKAILGIPGGSGDQMTSYLKKIGFAGSDGAPTALYKQFRNEATRGAAAASALRHGYGTLYKRNEYAHELSEAKLKGLIIEETGVSDDSSVVGNIVSCFKHIKSHADFSVQEESDVRLKQRVAAVSVDQPVAQVSPRKLADGVGLNLSYTINLNLPATSDIAVFNAIFKSLKDNMLRQDDE